MWDSIRRHLYSFVEKIMHYNDTYSQTQVHNYLNVKVSKNTIIFGRFDMQSIMITAGARSIVFLHYCFVLTIWFSGV